MHSSPAACTLDSQLSRVGKPVMYLENGTMYSAWWQDEIRYSENDDSVEKVFYATRHGDNKHLYMFKVSGMLLLFVCLRPNFDFPPSVIPKKTQIQVWNRLRIPPQLKGIYVKLCTFSYETHLIFFFFF